MGIDVPGHVTMSRDAVLKTAEAVAEQVKGAEAELRQAGAMLDASVYVERRLQALVELLLPDLDDQAALELRYQEKLLQWLTDVREQALQAARQQRLLAPAGAFHEAVQNGHGRG